MDSTFFAMMTEAAESEPMRYPAVGTWLTSLGQILLPLRTIIPSLISDPPQT